MIVPVLYSIIFILLLVNVIQHFHNKREVKKLKRSFRVESSLDVTNSKGATFKENKNIKENEKSFHESLKELRDIKEKYISKLKRTGGDNTESELIKEASNTNSLRKNKDDYDAVY